eukprot:1980838-Rhodomonas_salina.1
MLRELGTSSSAWPSTLATNHRTETTSTVAVLQGERCLTDKAREGPEGGREKRCRVLTESNESTPKYIAPNALQYQRQHIGSRTGSASTAKSPAQSGLT